MTVKRLKLRYESVSTITNLSIAEEELPPIYQTEAFAKAGLTL